MSKAHEEQRLRLDEMDEREAHHFLTGLLTNLDPGEEYDARHPDDYVLEIHQSGERIRGREMMHKELGLERLTQIVEDLSDVSKVEIPPRWFGRAASIMLAPDKIKIDAVKRKMSKEEAEAHAAAVARDAEQALHDQDADDDDHEDDKPKKASRKVSNPVEDEISSLLGE